MVKTVCNGTVAQRVQLQSLYKRFRSLDKEMIHSVLIRNNFNFSSATQELEKKAAAREDTPDAPSQSTQSSFAHTAKKPVKQGREPGQPVASAARKRKTRSKTGQMSQLRRDEEAVVKPFQEIEEQPSYDDLRAEAALHAKLRSEAFQKAAHARSLRQGEVAFFYAQQGHSHTEKMKEANMRAADLILKLQNDVSSQTLDLHGLHVEEAISALQEKLHSTTDSVLHVITGKGIHSKGEARIKPAVVQFLTNKNYTFEEQPGRVKVTLSTY
jgi:NEDD4-binding protein 2